MLGPIGTRHETYAPSTTPRQIVPSFPNPVADSSSERSSGLMWLTLNNRMSVEEIARTVMSSGIDALFQTVAVLEVGCREIPIKQRTDWFLC
jgi:hypothetical protein